MTVKQWSNFINAQGALGAGVRVGGMRQIAPLPNGVAGGGLTLAALALRGGVTSAGQPWGQIVRLPPIVLMRKQGQGAGLRRALGKQAMQVTWMGDGGGMAAVDEVARAVEAGRLPVTQRVHSVWSGTERGMYGQRRDWPDGGRWDGAREQPGGTGVRAVGAVDNKNRQGAATRATQLALPGQSVSAAQAAGDSAFFAYAGRSGAAAVRTGGLQSVGLPTAGLQSPRQLPLRTAFTFLPTSLPTSFAPTPLLSFAALANPSAMRWPTFRPTTMVPSLSTNAIPPVQLRAGFVKRGQGACANPTPLQSAMPPLQTSLQAALQVPLQGMRAARQKEGLRLEERLGAWANGKQDGEANAFAPVIQLSGNEFVTSAPVDPAQLAEQIGRRLMEEIHGFAVG